MPKIVWWWRLRRMTHDVYVNKLAYKAWSAHATRAFLKAGASGGWLLQRKYFPPIDKYKH